MAVLLLIKAMVVLLSTISSFSLASSEQNRYRVFPRPPWSAIQMAEHTTISPMSCGHLCARTNMCQYIIPLYKGTFRTRCLLFRAPQLGAIGDPTTEQTPTTTEPSTAANSLQPTIHIPAIKGRGDAIPDGCSLATIHPSSITLLPDIIAVLRSSQEKYWFDCPANMIESTCECGTDMKYGMHYNPDTEMASFNCYNMGEQCYYICSTGGNL